MMHAIEVTPFAADSNYQTSPPTADMNTRHPRLSREMSYRQNCSFVDTNPDTGQLYPGFEVAPPRLPD